MKVNKYILPSFTLLAILATVLIAQWTGQWITSGKELVDLNNLTTTDDIRGWMTLQQVADGFALEVSDLYTLLQLPVDLPPETALKDLEGIIPDFEVTTVRAVLAPYISPPAAISPSAAQRTDDNPPTDNSIMAQPTATATPVAPTLTPQPATSATEQATTTPLVSTLVTGAHVAQRDGSGTGPTPLPAGEILTGADIKGKHTLQDIVTQAAVPLDALLAALKLPADTDPTVVVRDLVEQGQITEIEVVRTAVSTLQGQ